MSSRARFVLGLVAVLVGLPLFCLASLAMIGKQLDDEAPAEGRLISPRERAARMEAARREFAAMTPAQHLAAAHAAMARNYNREEGTGGLLADAENHLAVIPADAPEHSQVAAVRAEMVARRGRALTAFSHVVRREAARLDEPAPATDDARTVRCHAADALRQGTSVGCIHDTGPGGSELVIGGMPCDRGTLETVTRAREDRDAMRRLGFRVLRCEHGDDARLPL